MTETKATLPVASLSYSQRRFGPRAELFAGFGALLALMAIMSFDSLRTLRAIETSDAQIRRDFLDRERTLEQVRAGLYESGNIVRDYILGGSDRNSNACHHQPHLVRSTEITVDHRHRGLHQMADPRAVHEASPPG